MRLRVDGVHESRLVCKEDMAMDIPMADGADVFDFFGAMDALDGVDEGHIFIESDDHMHDDDVSAKDCSFLGIGADEDQDDGDNSTDADESEEEDALEALDHVPFDEKNFDEELMVSGPSAANIQHIWTECGALNWVAQVHA